MTLTDIERQLKELSNWNRWGDGDELGSLNLMTPRTRRRAAKLVKRGVTVSLARVAEETKAVDNPNPFEQKMLRLDARRGCPGWWTTTASITTVMRTPTSIRSATSFFVVGSITGSLTRMSPKKGLGV
jgi:hypothetical protein